MSQLGSRWMTKRALVICAIATAIAIVVVVAPWLALHYVPSPFAQVTLRGDSVVATLRPDVSFGVLRSDTPVGAHVSGSESLEFRNGQSARLTSPRTSYRITCRTSPRPAGLYVEGSWFVHDYVESAVRIWFVEAH